MSTSEVQCTLQVLAARLSTDGHYLQAIKCYTGILGLSLLPADEAAARLKLSQLLLEHTHNIADAKQHLVKAEMLVTPLPGQQLLNCEVLAQLGRSHKYLGELTFQRQCYSKGLQLCKDSNSSNKRALTEWAVYFHLHTAESYTSDGEPTKAAEHAQAGCDLAKEQGMLEQQLLCLLFRLQLVMLAWDKAEAESLITAASEVLGQLEQPGSSTSPGYVALLKLHFTLLQVVFAIHLGNFQDLSPPNTSPPPIIADMEAQLESLLLHQGPALAYTWLPPPVLAALVQLLAATIYKPSGKVKPALVHISRGLQLVNEQLSVLRIGPAATESCLDHISMQQAHACLLLRLLLLEVRQQLHLLSSNFSAARQDAADNMQLLHRFPSLLAGLRPSVHLQAGLYAQSVGAFDAALGHFNKVAALSQDGHMRVCARCLAALCYMAQDTPNSVSHGRELLGDLLTTVDSGLGYAERAVAQIAGGLLQLAAPDASSDEKADAKQRLSKALKLAHGRLQNHQLVSQVLLFMTPLQVGSADSQGALAMVSSSFTLAKGAGDLHAQVQGLSMMQQLYHHNKQPDKAAHNYNYLARKQEELSSRIQEAEANTQQHAQVLAWDL